MGTDILVKNALAVGILQSPKNISWLRVKTLASKNPTDCTPSPASQSTIELKSIDMGHPRLYFLLFVDNLIHPLHSSNHGGETYCGKCQKHGMPELINGCAFCKRPSGM